MVMVIVTVMMMVVMMMMMMVIIVIVMVILIVVLNVPQPLLSHTIGHVDERRDGQREARGLNWLLLSYT
jgi:hypothetical protein